MNKPWPTVRLGEVIRHRKEFVTIDDLANYRRPRVQLHAQGIVLRDEVPGALIKTKAQQVCRAGEFLVAEIDAKLGGYGLVPKVLDGTIVSSHYFLFVVEENKLDRRFLDFFIRTPGFREQVEAQGSTNYAAIRPSHVLDYKVPLPPLAEQRRVVARIEELAAQIQEARTLRQQAVEDAETLTARAAARIFSEDFPKARLGSVSELINGDRGKNYPNKVEYVQEGMPWINTGHIEPDGSLSLRWMHYISREKFDSLRSGKVRPGDLVYCLRGATLGKTAIITQFDEGAVASSLVIIRPSTELDSRFAYWFLISPLGREQIFRFDVSGVGTTGRRGRRGVVEAG